MKIVQQKDTTQGQNQSIKSSKSHCKVALSLGLENRKFFITSCKLQKLIINSPQLFHRTHKTSNLSLFDAQSLIRSE